jgi:hypothetical protein
MASCVVLLCVLRLLDVCNLTLLRQPPATTLLLRLKSIDWRAAAAMHASTACCTAFAMHCITDATATAQPEDRCTQQCLLFACAPGARGNLLRHCAYTLLCLPSPLQVQLSICCV